VPLVPAGVGLAFAGLDFVAVLDVDFFAMVPSANVGRPEGSIQKGVTRTFSRIDMYNPFYAQETGLDVLRRYAFDPFKNNISIYKID
jgi:hypothetical protein